MKTASATFRILTAALMTVLTVTHASARQGDADYRTWTNRADGSTLEAALIRFDADERKVELRTRDGATQFLAQRDMAQADQNYVRVWLRNQRKASAKDKPQDESPAADSERSPSRAEASRDRGPERLFGLRWYRNMDDAKIAAAGDRGTTDDKPILWFRVLGDPAGFM
jgi:hypothetical protein